MCPHVRLFNSKTFVPVVVITLLLITFVPLNSIPVLLKSHAFEEDIKVYISKDVISFLMNSNSAVLGSAVLAVPGKGVISGTLDENSDNYIINFNTSKILKYNNRKINGLATITINFINYENNKVLTIVVSSYTEYLKLEVLRKTGKINLLAAAGKAAREASEDPLFILKEDKITIGPRYAELLVAIGKVRIGNVSLKLDLPPKLSVGAEQTCDPGYDEYPYPGTGIYQKVDWDYYSNLTSKIPDWWKKRFIDNPNYGYTVGEAYRRFARDLLSSYYLVSKAKYQSVDEALEWLRDYIAVGGRDDTSEGVNLINMDGYLGYDHWNNSLCCATITTSFPLLAYKVSHNLQDPDAKRLTHSFTIVFHLMNGTWTSGMLLAGWPLAVSEHPVYSEKNYIINEIPISFYNTSARVGAVIVENASLTFGPDYIVVYWEVDTQTCQDYYVIKPIAFIAPLYTVDYSFASIRKVYSTSGDPIGDYSNELAMSYLYSWVNTTKAGTDPTIDHRALYRATYNFSSSPQVNTTYSPAVDIPPFLIPILVLTFSSIEGPAGLAISSAFSVIASTGTFITSISATSVVIDFYIVQDAPLSREANVVITNFEAGARHAVGAPLFSSFIYIDASYENSGGGGPGCGPGWCPTGNISP